MDIIGSPAIRRTETKATYIWLVVDEKPNNIIVTVSISENLHNPISILKVSPANIVKLGDRLFNYLVKVIPSTGYLPNNVKTYKWVYNLEDQHAVNLP